MKSNANKVVSALRQIACGAVLACAALSASADPTLTNEDGVFDPFGGIDWNQAGNAITTGAIVEGGVVETVFWANAVNLNDGSGNIFYTPTLRPPFPGIPGTDGYEYTIYAVFTESVTCGVAVGDPCGPNADFTVISGSWTIYYDTTPDANLRAGTGIQDGDILMSGSVVSGGGTFQLLPSGNQGSFTYTGAVDYTNPAYLNPALASSNATATLQLGNSQTGWLPPTGMPGGPIPAGAFVFQADANQAFIARTVPEPTTLLLLGGALLGLAVARRRGSANT